MEDWKEYKLEEIGEVIGGATPSTKKASNYDGEISWITPKDLSNFNGRFITKGERTITKIGYESCSCKMLPKGSILFSSRAPIGYVAIAEKELCTNQGFKSIIPYENIVNNIFLYYLLVYQKDKIEGLGSGTTFKEVSGKVMKSVKVMLPSLPTQRKIACILSSLDDKIELNRRINANLEEQAQALFKSWFIDFEPFKDGKFVDSELGMIPEGWKVGKLSDLCSVITKGTTPTTLGKQFTQEGINFVKAECITESHSILSDKMMHIDDETNNLLKRSIIEEGDILFTIAGTLGRFARVHNDIIPANTNQAVAIIRPNTSKISTNYLYSFFLGNWHTDFYSKRIQQAVQANLSLTTIKALSLPLLPDDLSKQYNDLLSPLFGKIEENLQESARLSALRDTLLPKLMSGEIEI